MSLYLLRLTLVAGNLVPPLPSLNSLQTLREGEENECLSVFSVCLSAHALDEWWQERKRAREKGAWQARSWRRGKAREKVTKWAASGPLSLFFPLLLFLALLPLCSWDSSSPLFVVCPPLPCPQPSPHHVHLSSSLPRASGDAAIHQSLARKGNKTHLLGTFFGVLWHELGPRERVESYSCRPRSPLHYRIECPYFKEQECSCLHPGWRSMYQKRLNCMKKEPSKNSFIFSYGFWDVSLHSWYIGNKSSEFHACSTHPCGVPPPHPPT